MLGRLVNLRHLSTLVLILSLTACAGGDGGPAGGNIGGLAALGVVNWTAPDKRADNSNLLLGEIDGYNMYYGTESGDYPNQIFIDSCVCVTEQAEIPDIPSGEYYFVVTTVDKDGRESAFSSEIAITI